MVAILAGVLGPIFVVATLTALLCLLKRPTNGGTYEPNKNKLQTTLSFRKPWTTRSFTYRELEEATNCFDDGQRLTDATSRGAIYTGLLVDGSSVVVHKVECRDQRDLSQVLSRIEVLSAVFHRNMARIIGCCIDCGYTPLVVYEFPGNGTVEEHLRRGESSGIDWYQRLSIAAETASVLSFLQLEVSPPIFHHNLRSGCLFLDELVIYTMELFPTSVRNTAAAAGRQAIMVGAVISPLLVAGGRRKNERVGEVVSY